MARITDFSVLCFDVYGTLIDWEAGITAALEPLFTKAGQAVPPRAELLAVLHELEAEQQRLTPTARQRDILAAVHPRIAERFGLRTAPPTAAESAAFGASIGQWPAFPDSVAALRRLAGAGGYKLVVLSNTDREAFAATNAGPLQGVPFDLVITAEDVGSFKPAGRNFAHMTEAVARELGCPKDRILQTAQSQFHDHHPAEKAGIKSCWIVRPGSVMGNRDRQVYDWKFDTLGDMADAVAAEQS
ncbi:haloalkanoic acid dehalogenase [Cordyceps javanica]|uniref:Haloalkanoic acid dehalogenase n=1 Tax=Cordyceps javanica TaxID=43265 RepID=A0A545UMV1_9HYPO|nr:haloalkanoic acid dehalogenase [Cordyceps javanica]TQW02431.1 haloalkanoic acid dehalogenase [Cordyceps javanica]